MVCIGCKIEKECEEFLKRNNIDKHKHCRDCREDRKNKKKLEIGLRSALGNYLLQQREKNNNGNNYDYNGVCSIVAKPPRRRR